MAKRVYRIVLLPNGQLVREPIEFKGTEKIERKIWKDAESGLYLYKKKYEYQDKFNRDNH